MNGEFLDWIMWMASTGFSAVLSALRPYDVLLLVLAISLRVVVLSASEQQRSTSGRR